MTDSPDPDLAEALLAAAAADRERLLRSSDPPSLSSALAALGHRREIAAAEVLALVDQVVEDRGLRKTARRELHRLRSIGIEPPAQAPTAAADEPSRAATAAIGEAWASDI